MKLITQMGAVVLVAATLVMAAPANFHSAAALGARAAEMCGSFGQKTAGEYTIHHNNWGASSATAGSQCTQLKFASGAKIAWSTTWDWTGAVSSVKSYSNVALQHVDKQLKSIQSIPTTWDWTYSGSDITADVAFDWWLAPAKDASNTYEIMLWLAALGGARPISSTNSPIATPTVGGHTFELYSGQNGGTNVYSFVATQNIESFSGDLIGFFKYLVDNEGVSDSNYITSLQAGTEPFTGSNAVFSTSAYSLSVL